MARASAETMSVSVVSGRCGPCCSKEPSGKSTSLFAGFSLLTSGQVKFSRSISAGRVREKSRKGKKSEGRNPKSGKDRKMNKQAEKWRQKYISASIFLPSFPPQSCTFLSSIFLSQLLERLQNFLRQHLRCVLAERGILDLVSTLDPLLSRRHVCHPAVGVARQGGEWKGRAALDLQTSFTKRLDVAAHQGDLSKGDELGAHAGAGLAAEIIGHAELDVGPARHVNGFGDAGLIVVFSRRP